MKRNDLFFCTYFSPELYTGGLLIGGQTSRRISRASLYIRRLGDFITS